MSRPQSQDTNRYQKPHKFKYHRVSFSLSYLRIYLRHAAIRCLDQIRVLVLGLPHQRPPGLFDSNPEYNSHLRQIQLPYTSLRLAPGCSPCPKCYQKTDQGYKMSNGFPTFTVIFVILFFLFGAVFIRRGFWSFDFAVNVIL
jgi:hypothetical protein